MSNKSKLITYSPRLSEMVEELREMKGYTSDSAVFIAGVIELHTKVFPNYMRNVRPTSSPEDTLDQAGAVKKVKLDRERKKLLGLVEQLGGKVEAIAGNEVCVYYTYTGKKRYEQKVPLHMVSPDLIKTQYQPSKEAVLKLREAGKCDYEV